MGCCKKKNVKGNVTEKKRGGFGENIFISVLIFLMLIIMSPLAVLITYGFLFSYFFLKKDIDVDKTLSNLILNKRNDLEDDSAVLEDEGYYIETVENEELSDKD